MKSYHKALAIREAAAAANPNDEQIQSELLRDYLHLSFALQDSGDSTGALNDLWKGLPAAKRNAAMHDDPKNRDWLAGFYWQIGNILNRTGDYAGVLENFRQAVSIREPIARAANAPPLFRTHLAGDYVSMGETLWHRGEDNQALELMKKALEILEQLSRDDPTNATLREYLADTDCQFGFILEREEKFDQALDYYRRASRIFGDLISSDPTDSLASVNFGLTDLSIGRELVHLGQIQSAMTHIRKAIVQFEGTKDKNRDVTAGQAQSYSTLAFVYVTMANKDNSPLGKAGHLREARRWYEKSLSIWQKDPNNSSGDLFGGDETKDRVVQDLAKCNADLAKLQRRGEELHVP